MTHLIVIEGTEYAGKTTLAKMLVNALIYRGVDARYNKGVLHPNETASELERKASTADDAVRELFYTTACALDKDIDVLRQHDCVVIQDRYWPSVMAYGRYLNGTRSIHASLETHRLFIEPACIIYAYCSLAERGRRHERRTVKSDLDRFLLDDAQRIGALEHEMRTVLALMPRTLALDTAAEHPEATCAAAQKFLVEGAII